MRNDTELVACVAESGVPWQVTVVRSRPGLRNNVSSIRNEAEIIDAHAKVIGKRYTGRVAGKGSDLNKRLRVECLGESGTKGHPLPLKTHIAKHIRVWVTIYANTHTTNLFTSNSRM